MAPPEVGSGEPVSHASRIFLRPELNTIIHCAFGVRNKMDTDSVKSAIKNSLMVKHPRFRSLLVRDKNGWEHWKRTDIDIDQHLIIVNNKNGFCCSCDDDDIDTPVNDYLVDLLVSSPLDINKPFWKFHIILEQKCAILRIHSQYFVDPLKEDERLS